MNTCSCDMNKFKLVQLKALGIGHCEGDLVSLSSGPYTPTHT